MTRLTLPGRVRGALTVRGLLVAGAIVAGIATAGSLFLSLSWGLVPCRLCWYQRILMYPLVVLFGWAALEGRATAYRPALALALPGALVSTYHSWLQAAPGGSCSLGGCHAVQYRLEPLGLTIPNLALVAFLLVVALSLALALPPSSDS